jgi:ABC-2 type transport system ATP-binding protein
LAQSAQPRPFIDIDGVTKSFRATRALNDVSLQIKEGEIFGLVGPDGAGKTTLMRIVCGLITPDRGQVLIEGRCATEQTSARLGYMPQRFSIYGDLTVQENINFFGAMYHLSGKTIKERADEVFAITKLAPFVNRFADNLSGGMKQKLALTCALITRPPILILDEPTYGVDPESREDFWRMLYHLNQDGRTIMISTPYMEEAELCHKVAFMHSGNVALVDTPLAMKKGFPYHVLEISAQTRDPELLNNLAGVLVASLYGEHYHLIATDATTAQQAIAQRLAEKNVVLQLFKEVPPTMEDVFVSLAERDATAWKQ